MEMIKNLLKEVVILTVGKQAEPIADLLETQKHVNEFDISKKMDLTINQTRNILYRISDYGLVSSIRKKDKKKGWYTYFWRFEILKCLNFLKDLLEKRINELYEKIHERKQSIFYICKRCNLEVGEENALLMDFTCEECGDVFETKDNSKILRDLQKELMRAQEKLKIVDLEIEKENLNLDKKRDKEIKKEEKEKKIKREIAKKKREASKKKVVKKTTKKNAVKRKTAKKKIVKKKAVKKKVVKKKTVKKKTIKRKTAKKKPVKKK
jgi:transcription factor E